MANSVNSKLLLAFAGGTVLACAIVYTAVRSDSLPASTHAASVAKPIYIDPASDDPGPPPQAPSMPPNPSKMFLPGPDGTPGSTPVETAGEKPIAAETAPAEATPAAKTGASERVTPTETVAKAAPAPVTGASHEIYHVPEPAAVPASQVPSQKVATVTALPSQPGSKATPAPLEQVAKSIPPTPSPDVPSQPSFEAQAPQPKAEPSQLESPAPEQAGPVRKPRTVTIATATLLPVRIGETLATGKNRPGDSFLATLEQPLIIDGLIIAAKGARLQGRIDEADIADGTPGASHLSIELVRLSTADGQRIPIHTEAWKREVAAAPQSPEPEKATPGLFDRVVGAATFGHFGGSAARPTATPTAAHGIVIPVETRLTFRVTEPVTITEHLGSQRMAGIAFRP